MAVNRDLADTSGFIPQAFTSKISSLHLSNERANECMKLVDGIVHVNQVASAFPPLKHAGYRQNPIGTSGSSVRFFGTPRGARQGSGSGIRPVA